MGTDKPRITILLAVYEPRLDWLAELLDSLNAQTYPNLRLRVRDDCSSAVPYEEIRRLVAERITAFPYEMERNEKNLGSNRTFERLTAEAEGDYFAYCDQDDIWLPEKLELLQETLEREKAELVCSDMYIINGEGRQVSDSITKIRKHHVFRSGEGLAPELLIFNFVTGCTVLVRAEQAKAAIPFCPYMIHDHFLALWCAERGKIVSLPDRLIRYRVHANNQTRAMAGVHDKASYVEIRIRGLMRRLVWLRQRFADRKDLTEAIGIRLAWARAREENFAGVFRAKGEIWRYRRFSPLTSLFEIVMAGAPNALFMWFIQLKRKNVI